VTLLVSSTPVPPILGSAAPVTSTADSVAMETERIDKEILVEQNTKPVTLLVSSTLVPPPHVPAARPMPAFCVDHFGLDYVYAFSASPAGEAPMQEASAPLEHVNPAQEEPTSPSPPTHDTALESSNSAEQRDGHQP